MSIAGGYYKAAEAAAKAGMETFQCFTKNNNQWKAKDISDEEARLFRQAVRDGKLKRPTAHDCYLINLASPDPALYRKSIEAFVVEVQRAEKLGLDYLVMHPGSCVDDSEEHGLERIIRAIDETHRRCPGFRVRILLETTAGQGSSLGYRFEHLARILEGTAESDRLGVCLDTCHVFAAGYPLAPEKEYRATMRTFDQVIGLHRLCAFHLNDSARPFASRVDRHAHIGKGYLGLEPFRLLVNDRRFRRHPMILETPKEDGRKKDMDSVNLRVLRRLVKSSR
ncbi:MAG: putative endonuclease 4 [Gemmatales bacterium]|nr:MAG: putative endonuclease 4 [Gemmatales bacterium]